MIHHDLALFQKVGTTGFRTGSLSYMDVLYLSPGAPPEFPPSYLLTQKCDGIHPPGSPSTCALCFHYNELEISLWSIFLPFWIDLILVSASCY